MARPRRRAGTQPQHDARTVQRGHVNVAAERRLGERHGNPHREVVALATEQSVRSDVTLDDQVPWRPAVATGSTATLEPNLLTVRHTRGDPCLHLAPSAFGARAVTGRTGVGHDHAASTADAAWRREREQTWVGVDDAPPAAVRTHDRLGPRLGTAAMTGRALRIAGEVQRRGEPLRRVGEVEIQRCLDVGAALRAGGSRRTATASTAAEHLGQHISQAVAVTLKLYPPGPPGPPPWKPPIGPSLRTSSYSLRLASSPSTSYAALTSLNRSSAASSPGCVSGWLARANFRYALVMSLGAASSLTPRTL